MAKTGWICYYKTMNNPVNIINENINENNKAALPKRPFYQRLLIGAITAGIALGINILVYFILVRGFKINYLIGNAWAWLVYVIFQYAARKYFFYRYTAVGFGPKVREFFQFIGLRLGTGILDMVLMFILVSVIGVHIMNAKFVVLAIVTITLTILTRFWVFKDRSED